MTPCPDFDLAPLQPFDPTLLLGGKNSADALLIVLATAYNDLKDQMWLRQQLDKCAPPVGVSAEYGQWQGMRIHFTRAVAGILNELVVAMESAHGAGLLDDVVLRRAVSRCSEATRAAWDDLVGVATGVESATEFRKYLNAFRNRASFHYDRTRLWEGYRHHFAERTQDAFNETGFISLGETIGSTRFYFADAAAADAYQLFDLSGGKMEEVNRHVKAMNLALRNVIAAYLIERVRQRSLLDQAGASGHTH